MISGEISERTILKQIHAAFSAICNKIILRYSYYEHLTNQIDMCERLCQKAPRKTALHMIFWNSKILMKHVPSQKR